MLIGIENKKECDELVKKVLTRIKTNNLYIKLEKYKWKVRKVGYLGVVIRLDGIKIEKVTVKVVLDWPVSKMVKKVQKFLGLANHYR